MVNELELIIMEQSRTHRKDDSKMKASQMSNKTGVSIQTARYDA
jgi:hypothetical protein